MKNIKWYLSLFPLLLPLAAGAQNISVTSAVGQNIADFVETQLQGSGVYITNVKFNNQAGNVTYPQIGTFRSNGYPKLQMDSGVVMTTGNVSFAVGPNNQPGGSISVSPDYTDNMSQMAALVSDPLTSCATIDFDFVSISPFVTLNYCFGSEEYPQYVWSSFNDVFAFFVSGPDPNTGNNSTWNIAIIPHTANIDATYPAGIPVAINTVNGNTTGGNASQHQYHYNEFFVKNYGTSTGDEPHNNNAAGVQYNGFTQKLSANATLQPCTQYHMHISICNVFDRQYDSGVFLEKGSFNSPSADVDLSHRYADTIERSRPMVMPLTLDGTDYTEGHVTVSFGGDAVVGRDYTVVTDSNRTLDQEHRTFNIDDQNHWLTIRCTDTADLSSPKSVEIYLATSLCPLYPALQTYDTLRYLLAEDDVVRLRHDTIVAYDTCREVGVEVAIGNPVTFHWMPEDGIDFPRQQYSTALITSSRTYRVAAADTRGHTDTTTIYIDVRPRSAIDYPSPAAGLRVWPNPVDGLLNVEADGISLIEVFDVTGRCVLVRHGDAECRTLDISTLPAGLYTLRAVTPAGIRTVKVMAR